MNTNKKVVDFDYFYFEGVGFNYDIAKELAVILIDEINIDELKGMHEENERWDSSVGTGGSGSNYVCPSQGAQRATLASHFASYANRKYQSCYLSLYEFSCLKTLLDYLEEDWYPEGNHMEKLQNKKIELLTQVCDEFEKAYVKQNPEYYFTMLLK